MQVESCYFDFAARNVKAKKAAIPTPRQSQPTKVRMEPELPEGSLREPTAAKI